MRILLTGASGQLGAYLLRALQRSAHTVAAWSGRQHAASLQPVDLTQPAAVRRAWSTASPDVVIHAAALASVAACQQDPARAQRINIDATRLLTELSQARGARLVYISTDLVFDGERGGYREEDVPSPLSVYGRTKRQAEDIVLGWQQSLVVRVSLLYGPSLPPVPPRYFEQQVARLQQGQPIQAFADEWRTPLSLHNAADALLALAEGTPTGLLHLGGPERHSRLELMRLVARYLGVAEGLVQPTARDDVPAPEPRPRDTSLDTTRWQQLMPGMPWLTVAAALPQLPWRA